MVRLLLLLIHLFLLRVLSLRQLALALTLVVEIAAAQFLVTAGRLVHALHHALLAAL